MLSSLKLSPLSSAKYNQLMKDFPLYELLSAADLDKIQESLILFFSHISLPLSPYPIQRALPLVKAISHDFNDQLLRILTSQWFPYTPYWTSPLTNSHFPNVGWPNERIHQCCSMLRISTSMPNYIFFCLELFLVMTHFESDSWHSR